MEIMSAHQMGYRRAANFHHAVRLHCRLVGDLLINPLGKGGGTFRAPRRGIPLPPDATPTTLSVYTGPGRIARGKAFPEVVKECLTFQMRENFRKRKQKSEGREASPARWTGEQSARVSSGVAEFV